MLDVRPEVINGPPLLAFRVLVLIRPFGFLLLELSNALVTIHSADDLFLHVPVRRLAS